MKKRKTIYTNLLRTKLKFVLKYNALRFSPAVFLYYLLLVLMGGASILSIILLVFSTILIVYRVMTFTQFHDTANLLELEIGKDTITLITTRTNYTISFDEVIAIGLRADPSDEKKIDIFLQVEDEAQNEWPSGLKEVGYLKIPMIFEDHSIEMLDEHLELKAKCKNYQSIKTKMS